MQSVTVEEIDPKAVKEKLDRKEPILLLDVREDDEVALARIPNSYHVPMQWVPARIPELPREKEIVVYCHHGQRSLLVAQYLKRRGFEDVKNLRGGIDEWSLEVDPSVPRYER